MKISKFSLLIIFSYSFFISHSQERNEFDVYIGGGYSHLFDNDLGGMNFTMGVDTSIA